MVQVFVAVWLLSLLSAPAPGSPVSAAPACHTVPLHTAVGGAAYHLKNCPNLRRLAADWQPPEALLLAYSDTWPAVLKAIIAGAKDDTPVYLLVNPADDLDGLQAVLNADGAQGVRLVFIYFDTPWVRDYGPLQVRRHDGINLWLDLTYSEERSQDDEFPSQLASHLRVRSQVAAFSLDGGAVISNGLGLCVMTHRSLADAQVGASDLKDLTMLQRTLGCEALAVIPDLASEPTGHADVVGQFLAADTLAWASVDNLAFPWYAELLDAGAATISAAAAALGQPLNIIRVPMPIAGDVFYSYLNATRLGRRMLVPSFLAVDEQEQNGAYAILSQALGDTELYPIPADTMIALGGAVHCISLGVFMPPPKHLSKRARQARPNPRRCGAHQKWVHGRCMPSSRKAKSLIK